LSKRKREGFKFVPLPINEYGYAFMKTAEAKGKNMLIPRLAIALLTMAMGNPMLARAADSVTDHAMQPLQPIEALDVPRYMGRWYEIAKYPNRFQRKCTGDTQATYALNQDGTVAVTNTCKIENGETEEALGVARQIGQSGSPKLEVRFAPAWLSFIPLVWGDYWVIDLDPGYQLAAVGEPKREYLWILSRTPQVKPNDYAALLERLRAKGYDTSKLEPTRR
jgi:apolipoprotein D and lipocalin family protein